MTHTRAILGGLKTVKKNDPHLPTQPKPESLKKMNLNFRHGK